MGPPLRPLATLGYRWNRQPVVPWLWRAAMQRLCTIIQNMSSPTVLYVGPKLNDPATKPCMHRKIKSCHKNLAPVPEDNEETEEKAALFGIICSHKPTTKVSSWKLIALWWLLHFDPGWKIDQSCGSPTMKS
jgi:hypothetical protein